MLVTNNWPTSIWRQAGDPSRRQGKASNVRRPEINPTVAMIRQLNIPSAHFWQKGIRANLRHVQAALLGANQAGLKTLKMYGPRNRSTGMVGPRKLCQNLMTLYLMSGLTDNAGPLFQPGLEKSLLWSSCFVRSAQSEFGESITHHYIYTWQDTPASEDSLRYMQSQCAHHAGDKMSTRHVCEFRWVSATILQLNCIKA